MIQTSCVFEVGLHWAQNAMANHNVWSLDNLKGLFLGVQFFKNLKSQLCQRSQCRCWGWGVAAAGKSQVEFCTLLTHRPCPFHFQLQSPWKNLFHFLTICLTPLVKESPYPHTSCHIVLSLSDASNTFPALPCHWKLGCCVSRKLLSSTCSSAAVWTPAGLCLLCVSHRAEVHNHIGSCFILTASASFWQSQIVSFYANFHWLVTLTRFKETAAASEYVRDIAGILKIRHNHSTDIHLGLSQGMWSFFF